MKFRINVLVCGVLMLSLFIKCKNNQVNNKIETINLVKAFEKKKEIELSDLVESIEYICLSSEDSLVGNAVRIFTDKDYIVTIAHKQQLLFDRKTGNFIREIGHREKGPNGFAYTKTNLAYNEKRKTVYSGGWNRNILEYSLDGKIIRDFERPDSVQVLDAFVWLNDSIHACYVSNFTGNDISQILLINRNTNRINKIRTNDRFKKNPKNFVVWGGEKEGWFYRYNNQLFIKEYFNDTVFKLNENKLAPRYTFQSTQFKPDAYQRNFYSKDELKDFHLIEKVFESKRYLFFTVKLNGELRCGLYDKKKQETSISNAKTPDSYFFNIPCFGFNNDIDNFIQFCPHYMNQNNEVIASVESYEVVAWLNANPDKAAKIPHHLQKLKEIKETDNPVVIIAKLKE